VLLIASGGGSAGGGGGGGRHGMVRLWKVFDCRFQFHGIATIYEIKEWREVTLRALDMKYLYSRIHFQIETRELRIISLM
jgi:hypothetical protein